METNLEWMGLHLQLKNKVFITFDIDWAPDHMVNHIIDLCLKSEVSATFFVTHFSPTLERLRAYPHLFEVGLHPNFLPGSTQGDTSEKIFNYCKKLVPDAVSIRPHCVYQHGRLYDQFNKHFGERIVDSSICMPGVSSIQAFELHTPSGRLVRVPFFWADDYYLLGKQILDPVDLLAAEGAKIYMFHPIHIFQNTQNIEQYEMRKKNSLFGCSNDRNQNTFGMAFIFDRFIHHLKPCFNTGLMKEFLQFNEEH